MPAEISETTAAGVRCQRCWQPVTRRYVVQNSWDNDTDSRWCAYCRRTYASYCEEHHAWWDRRGNALNGELGECRECAEENGHTFVCDSCGRRQSNDNYAGDGLCDTCDNSSRSNLPDHCADAPCHKFGKGPHYYGVELEVEGGQDTEATYDALGHSFIVCKDDGSLSDGFEIVTAPASLDEHRSRWPAFFESASGDFRSFQTKTCGLHVHCSRAPLSDLTVAKIVCFVNARQNRRFMSIIAARASGQWSEYHDKTLRDVVYTKAEGGGIKTNGCRYEAVNLQNDHTIEFRIFKGTLKEESLYKAVEFCDALIAFCLPAARSLTRAQSKEDFCAFVKENVKRWPHLAAFIAAKWNGIETKASKAFGYAPVVRENMGEPYFDRFADNTPMINNEED